MKKGNRIGIPQLLSMIFIFGITIYITIVVFQNQKENQITYDEAIDIISKKECTKVLLKGTEITIILNDESNQFCKIPSIEEFTSFMTEEIQKGNDVKFEVTNSKFTLDVGTILLIVILLYVTKLTSENESKIDSASSNVKFDDVAGIEEEKEQLEEIVEFLKNPKKYTSMGASIPKGILLYGNPGTGKTLLAKAIAGEAGVPFFEVTASSFDEKFVGVGASRVRKLFNKAKKNSPCIIFIDEIDTVAKTRYSDYNTSEQTLNQLLAEMDGFNSDSNIIVVAATNHIEILDPAITRPGRFDRHIYVPRPDAIAREKIINIYAKDKPLAEDVSLEKLAKKTVGFTGADLKNILNEAAIYAVNNNKAYISSSDIDEAIARVLIGLEKKNTVISEEDKRRTAVHEAGHAIVSAVLRPNVKILGISIIKRGTAGGYNQYDMKDYLYRIKSDIEHEICTAYAGRLAEKVILKEVSSGSSNDLQEASKLAYLMVKKYSMGKSLLVEISDKENYNIQLNKKSIDEMEEICRQLYELTSGIVKNHEDVIEDLADILYEKEYLSEQDIAKFLKENNLI